MPTGPKGMAAPRKVRQHLGKGVVDKGRWDKLYVWAWDFAEVCSGKKCELYEICVFKDSHRAVKLGEKSQAMKTNKCGLQQRYLRTVLHAIIETLKQKKVVSTEQMIRMGYQMIPLYSQLFKFKKLEYTNTLGDITYISGKGAMKVNPIYKEIREIIKTIEGIWIKIGGNIRSRKSSNEIGDSGYMDAMYAAVGEVVIEDEEEEVQVPDANDYFEFPQLTHQASQAPQKKRRRRK